jgi:hypothetical protein
MRDMLAQDIEEYRPVDYIMPTIDAYVAQQLTAERERIAAAIEAAWDDAWTGFPSRHGTSFRLGLDEAARLARIGGDQS